MKAGTYIMLLSCSIWVIWYLIEKFKKQILYIIKYFSNFTKK